MKKYPVALPWLGEEEVASVGEVIRSGWVTQGPRVGQFEEVFAARVGAPHACAVSNCTVGLHLALKLVGVDYGDVVLTVSHSFIATANSVRHCGAEPFFVDIDIDTLNMDPAVLQQVLEENFEERDGQYWLKDCSRFERGESPLRRICPPKGRLAAILPVHQVGMPADMRSILAIAHKYNVPVVEDAACAIGSRISLDGGSTWDFVGQPHGDVACFSMHPRKVLTTGDGGMMTMKDEALLRKAHLLRQHGMDTSDLARHGSNSIVFEGYATTGYNGRLTDIQAAVGLEQLKRIDVMVERRRLLADVYAEALGDIDGIIPPREPDYVRTNWQSYVTRLEDPSRQVDVMQKLLDLNVATRRGVMNAHLEAPYSPHWDREAFPPANWRRIAASSFPSTTPWTRRIAWRSSPASERPCVRVFRRNIRRAAGTFSPPRTGKRPDCSIRCNRAFFTACRIGLSAKRIVAVRGIFPCSFPA